jgi:hypothetical protein
MIEVIRDNISACGIGYINDFVNQSGLSNVVSRIALPFFGSLCREDWVRSAACSSYSEISLTGSDGAVPSRGQDMTTC